MKKFFKILFRFLSFKKELFTFLKKLRSAPENIYPRIYFDEIFGIKADEARAIKKVSKLTKSEDFNFLIVSSEKSSLFDYQKYVSYS